MSRYPLAFDLFTLITLVQLHRNWSPGSPLRASCLCSAPTTLCWRLCFIPWIPTSLSLVENLTSTFGPWRARLSPRDRACLRWSHGNSSFRNLSCYSSSAGIVKWSPCVFVSLLFSLETREAKVCVVCSVCWEWRCYHRRLQWKYLRLGQRYNLNRSEWSQPFLQGIQTLNLQTTADWLTVHLCCSWHMNPYWNIAVKCLFDLVQHKYDQIRNSKTKLGCPLYALTSDALIDRW